MDSMQYSSQRARSIWRTLIAAAMLLPAVAWAQPAFTTHSVNLRAGPDRSFPLVAWVPAGTQVSVFGCINAWTWCDIQVGFNRGWAFAQFLSMPFQNQPIIIGNAGAWLGVPLIAFSVGPYWDSHYRDRPWWGYRNQWASRPPPPAWGAPQGPHWCPPPGPGWRPPPQPSRPPIAQPRPPRPPSISPPPGGGRPPGGGNSGGGRPRAEAIRGVVDRRMAAPAAAVLPLVVGRPAAGDHQATAPPPPRLRQRGRTGWACVSTWRDGRMPLARP